MAKKAKMVAPSALHDVVIRGIERRKVFGSDSIGKSF
jgi:hypothetical protein